MFGLSRAKILFLGQAATLRMARLASGCSTSAHVPAPKVDPMSEAAQGFDSVLQRAAGILINISERTMMKVLHVHCGSRLGYYLGQSTVFDMTGVSTSPRIVEECKKLRYYKDAALVDAKLDVLKDQYRTGTFQACVCLHPPSTGSEGDESILTVQDALRLVTHDGFVLYGATEDTWEREGVQDQVESAEQGGGGPMTHCATLLSIQILDVGQPYLLSLLRKKQ